ncbi:uncharacterized protein BT62DRAFT_935224 [Guyanagaster necrorhizus]|uniref:Uncharacterized protein n=1 Tax=Guyanagaster necrorhizus TaxID=856835 RepID=A0A9P8AQX0_9AGAR|nr:uncharacterized protein BT62DRAFT_935224 [Guyanagaster necrorhizus MCA 3950]KAG7443272.1 hypothetical protein BT62DRAFT_935224 [Guyanagaster necrorhizus MCA 3950]
MIDIPQELVDLIVDGLQDDKKALRAALHLSPSFRSRAQYLLFRAVNILYAEECARFNELCRISPSVPPLVRGLRIVAWDGQPRPDSDKLRLHNLPNLDKIYISGYSAGRNCVIPWVSASAIGPQVSYAATSMKLEGMHFPSAQSFRSCLESFARLKTLTINALLIHDAKSIEDVSSAPGPPIEMLTILSSGMRNNHERAFVGPGSAKTGWRKPFGLHALRKLQMVFFKLGLVSQMQNILDITRDTIQEVSLLPYSEGSDLEKCKDNHILNLSRVPLVNFGPLSMPFAWDMKYLVKCLRKGAPARLNITIYFDEGGFEDLRVGGTWMAIDNAMRDKGSLLCFTVKLEAWDNEDTIKGNLSVLLPKMHSAGRLSFLFTKDRIPVYQGIEFDPGSLGAD